MKHGEHLHFMLAVKTQQRMSVPDFQDHIPPFLRWQCCRRRRSRPRAERFSYENKDMLVLPDLSCDMRDKVVVFRSLSATSPMPSDSDAERQLYHAALEAELPSVVQVLQDWEIPESMRSTRTDVVSYHNPIIVGKLEAPHPEVLLVEMIHQASDNEILMTPPETMWQGTAIDFHKVLTNSTSHAFARSASELLSTPKATGMYLGRITDASEHFQSCYQLCIRQGPHRRGIKTYLIHVTRPETQATLL
jgi:hypothetical protein